MQQIEIPLASDADLSNAENIIEHCCAAEGLRLTLKGTLVKYPGCIHWHYKRSQQPGTLEITFWRRRIWFKISGGRQGDWMAESTARLSTVLQTALRN